MILNMTGKLKWDVYISNGNIVICEDFGSFFADKLSLWLP